MLQNFLETGAANPTAITVDFSAITDALAKSVNAGQVSAIIGTVLASTVGISVLWWGARKLVHSITSAFKTGKIKF